MALINRLAHWNLVAERCTKVAIMGRRMAVMERRGERLATGIVALALRDRPAARDAVLRRIPGADLDTRTYLTQGVLGGGVFAIGYGLGVFWRWLWSYMELPNSQGTPWASPISSSRSFAR